MSSGVDQHDGGVFDTVTLLGSSCLKHNTKFLSCFHPVLVVVQSGSSRVLCTSWLSKTTSSGPTKFCHWSSFDCALTRKVLLSSYSSDVSNYGRDAALVLSLGQSLLCYVCFVCGGYFRINRCGVGLRSLLAASGTVLVLKHLPSIKIWYAFDVLSKKKPQFHKYCRTRSCGILKIIFFFESGDKTLAYVSEWYIYMAFIISILF
jgi:hypothetical protein